MDRSCASVMMLTTKMLWLSTARQPWADGKSMKAESSFSASGFIMSSHLRGSLGCSVWAKTSCTERLLLWKCWGYLQ
eukprot:4834833-Karenia_brevis.AAC.1